MQTVGLAGSLSMALTMRGRDAAVASDPKAGRSGPPIRSSAENECLLSGDGVLEEVRILDGRELNRKAAVEMAHHPAGCLADAYHRSDRRPAVADYPDA